ncbi:hypothetical protein BC940DRAFT_329245 [Gongronella butleri]|nr:hypothetical protein BC940DRAFT_329245 [Gongronella butleri]
MPDAPVVNMSMLEVPAPRRSGRKQICVEKKLRVIKEYVYGGPDGPTQRQMVERLRAQRWYQDFNNLNRVASSKKKNQIKNQISDEHIAYIQEKIDGNNTVLTVVDIHKDLCAQFENLKVTKSAVSSCIKNNFSISLSLHPPPLSVDYDETIEREDFFVGWANPDLDYMRNCISFDEIASFLTK